jgi:lipopolysaccharide/colanic/teichoic acid biosynthesis glycosyltransferase
LKKSDLAEGRGGRKRPVRDFSMTVFCRTFNFVFAVAGLVALAPVLLLIAIAIKWEDGGPVFYLQKRIGRNFRPFCLIKFRSMTIDAEKQGLLTASADRRVTPCGRFLRRSKLDELPQLWNVLKGEMQLVGPRPEVERYVEKFRDEYSTLLSGPPGITDPASLAFRREEQLFVGAELERQYIFEILPQKLRLSLEYQQRRNMRSDVRILVKTLLSCAS